MKKRKEVTKNGVWEYIQLLHHDVARQFYDDIEKLKTKIEKDNLVFPIGTQIGDFVLKSKGLIQTKGYYCLTFTFEEKLEIVQNKKPNELEIIIDSVSKAKLIIKEYHSLQLEKVFTFLKIFHSIISRS